MASAAARTAKATKAWRLTRRKNSSGVNNRCRRCSYMQCHNERGGAASTRLHRARRPAPTFAHFQVQHLDKDRESHGEIGVPLGNMKPEAVANQVHPDEQKKTERQHLQR